MDDTNASTIYFAFGMTGPQRNVKNVVEKLVLSEEP